MRTALLATPMLLLACSKSDLEARPDRMADPLALTITSPAYGAFLGDEPILVRGQVSDPTAILWVEGEPVKVDGAGRFAVVVPFSGDYEVIDVQAGRHGEPAVRQRIPVFAGRHPSKTFGNDLPARMTNDGLERLGIELGKELDRMGWSQMLFDVLPSTSVGDSFELTANSVTHQPTKVILKGAEGGLDVGISVKDFVIAYDVRFKLPEILGSAWITLPLSVGYGTVELTALATPGIRGDGIVYLSLSNLDLEIGDATVRTPLEDLPWVGETLASVTEFLLDGLGFAVGWLVDLIGNFLLELIREIDVGGPFNFETDLMGTQLAVALRQVWGDPDGLALGATIGIDEPAPLRDLRIPMPEPSTRVSEPVHLVVGVHEGLFDGLIGGAIDDVLADGFDIGPFAAVLGTVVGNLPGGEYAPDTRNWCLDLTPGPASVFRLREGIAPLGALYLPDVDLTIGESIGGQCEPWIKTNLALEARLNVVGTRISIQLAIGDGGVMYYGAPETRWTEEAVLSQITSLVGTLAGVLGGQLSFDLDEMLGGIAGEGFLGEVSPKLLDSQQMSGFDGQPLEGQYALSLSVWPPE